MAISIIPTRVDPPTTGNHTHPEIHALRSCRCSDAIIQARALSIVFSDDFKLKLATAIVSLLTVAISSYMKGFDPGATAQKHRDAAADIWPIRESYLSLLTDIATGDIDVDAIRQRRDDLQNQLAAIYRGAPHTTSGAYGDAQVALKKNEEYTFSDAEIDKFLPKELRRAGIGNPAEITAVRSISE
jgi:hypothetical protein